jgi:hypothetical protein
MNQEPQTILPGREQILLRAISIVAVPSSTWPKIFEEKDSIHELYRHYILPISIIPGISALFSSLLIDRLPFISALLYSLSLWIMTFAFPALMALIVEKLTRIFEGQSSPLAALKLVAYAITPWCSASICFLLPEAWSQLATVLGFYSLYVFFLGIPLATHISDERMFAFFSTALFGMCMIILFDLAVLSALRAGMVY